MELKMFDKLKAGLNVFRKGSEVANPEAWKAGQITGTIVGALLIALVNLAQAYNVQLPIDADSANAIGGGIVAVANILLTAATSRKAGILPAKQHSSESSEGMPNVGISEETRAAALQYVSKADLLNGLDTTYNNN